jgi:hypothetical protein
MLVLKTTNIQGAMTTHILVPLTVKSKCLKDSTMGLICFLSTDWNGYFAQEHQCAVMLSVSASLFPHEL